MSLILSIFFRVNFSDDHSTNSYYRKSFSLMTNWNQERNMTFQDNNYYKLNYQLRNQPSKIFNDLKKGPYIFGI